MNELMMKFMKKLWIHTIYEIPRGVRNFLLFFKVASPNNNNPKF